MATCIGFFALFNTTLQSSSSPFLTRMSIKDLFSIPQSSVRVWYLVFRNNWISLMSLVLKFIGHGWPKSGYSSNWLSTALFEYHITIMSELSGAKLSICQELITNYLSTLRDSTGIQKRSFCHLHYSFLFIVVPSSWWSNWINAQIFNLCHAQISDLDLVDPPWRVLRGRKYFCSNMPSQHSVSMAAKT